MSPEQSSERERPVDARRRQLLSGASASSFLLTGFGCLSLLMVAWWAAVVLRRRLPAPMRMIFPRDGPMTCARLCLSGKASASGVRFLAIGRRHIWSCLALLSHRDRRREAPMLGTLAMWEQC